MNRPVTRTLAAAVLAFATGQLTAADPVAADTKTLDRSIVASLRDVHDRGADLYNLSKDYTGAYRIYEGALLAVKPLLTHRPEVQRAIDTGVATAGQEADPARRAFLLHETIEKVRADLKGTATPKKPAETVKPEPKKTVEPRKPEPKKPTEKKEPAPTSTPKPKPKDKPEPAAKGGAAVSGKITLKGQPLADGTVTFVSLDKKAPKVVSATIKDGAYAAKDVPPGKYAVTVAGEKVQTPAKYATTDTSGLTVEVKAGVNSLDFDLK